MELFNYKFRFRRGKYHNPIRYEIRMVEIMATDGVMAWSTTIVRNLFADNWDITEFWLIGPAPTGSKVRGGTAGAESTELPKAA